jgi:hypothetical protein
MGCVTVHKIIRLLHNQSLARLSAMRLLLSSTPPSDWKNYPAGGFEKIRSPEQQLEFAFSENCIKVVVLLFRVTQQVRQIYTSMLSEDIGCQFSKKPPSL